MSIEDKIEKELNRFHESEKPKVEQISPRIWGVYSSRCLNEPNFVGSGREALELLQSMPGSIVIDS